MRRWTTTDLPIEAFEATDRINLAVWASVSGRPRSRMENVRYSDSFRSAHACLVEQVEFTDFVLC
jgi:hypothetical protein